MPLFHFFTDLDTLQPQTQNQAFGPLGIIDGKDQYQVTSLHSATVASNAYAVCDGIVAVQEVNGNADLVNIILKVLQHPRLNFVPIKYIIYKGILKSSLIDNNGVDIAVNPINDLTQDLWLSQTARNKSMDKALGNPPNTTQDKPYANALGIHLTASTLDPTDTLLDSDLLEKLFYRKSDYQLPIVQAGWNMGTFQASDFGIEFISDTLMYEPSMQVGRMVTQVIQVDALSISATSTQVFEHWHKKETILHYLDPCAFYGSFYEDKIRCKVNGRWDKKKNDDIYTDILTKFYTHNILYLDIRNEHNHSYNYYLNYNNQFNIGLDGNAPVTDSYTKVGSWPIYRIATSAFNPSVSRHGEVSIQLVKGDTDLPSIYLEQGYYKEDYPKQRVKLKEINFLAQEIISKPITLLVPKTTNNVVVPCYIKLRYLKRIVQSPDTATQSAPLTFQANYFIDNLFNLHFLVQNTNLNIPWDTTETTRWYTSNELVFVDASSGYKTAYMAKVGVVEDKTSVYFFCVASGDELQRTDMGFELGSNTSKDTNFFDSITQRYNSVAFYREDLMIQSSTQSALNTSIFEEKWNNSVMYATGEDLVMLALTKIEWNEIVTILSEFSPQYDKRFVVKNLIEEIDDNEQGYQKGEIWIRGYKVIVGQIQLEEVRSTIVYYLENSVKVIKPF